MLEAEKNVIWRCFGEELEANSTLNPLAWFKKTWSILANLENTPDI